MTMPKYRLLTSEELDLFEKEFIDYLVVNTITADDWVKIKTTDKEKASKILSLFSDVILEKVLRQTHYVKKINHDSIICFHFQAEHIIMIGIQSSDKRDISAYIKGEISDLSGVELLTSSKTYTKQRELELFDMISKGAVISDGQMYKKLMLLSAENAQ